jgi:hypothetical protein
MAYTVKGRTHFLLSKNIHQKLQIKKSCVKICQRTPLNQQTYKQVVVGKKCQKDVNLSSKCVKTTAKQSGNM